MSRLTSLAIILIAFCTLLTRAEAQNAYRCGNSYSQAPCPGGVAVDANDSRSKAQKAQSESVIKRDVRTADSMEKTRLQREEAQKRAARKSTDKTADKNTTAQATPGKATQSTKKKANQPKYFTAAAPGDKKKKKSDPTPPSTSTAGNTSAQR